MSGGEKCALCPPDPVTTVSPDEDLALCNGHWSRWVFQVLATGDTPPCAAHLIEMESDQ